MTRRTKDAIVEPKTLCEPVIFISSVSRSGRRIDHFVEIWVGDVDFPGGDADYGAVLFVEIDYFEGVLTAEPEVVVGFVPDCVSNG
jgi:hypothetical protein